MAKAEAAGAAITGGTAEPLQFPEVTHEIASRRQRFAMTFQVIAG